MIRKRVEFRSFGPLICSEANRSISTKHLTASVGPRQLALAKSTVNAGGRVQGVLLINQKVALHWKS
jgi:hypothetical protein